MFVLLGSVTYVLFRRLKKHRALEDDQTSSEVLAPEQRDLIWVFCAFELSYLARAIFDLYLDNILGKIVGGENTKNFLYSTLIMLSYSLFDGIPLLFLLRFHWQNFVRKPKIPS